MHNYYNAKMTKWKHQVLCVHTLTSTTLMMLNVVREAFIKCKRNRGKREGVTNPALFIMKALKQCPLGKNDSIPLLAIVSEWDRKNYPLTAKYLQGKDDIMLHGKATQRSKQMALSNRACHTAWGLRAATVFKSWGGGQKGATKAKSGSPCNSRRRTLQGWGWVGPHSEF